MFRRAEARWQQRWEARTTGAQRLSVVHEIEVRRHTPAQVWAFVRPAESAVLLAEDVVRAFIVPGTGPGVGEQQCFVMVEDGREVHHVVTVVAEEPNRFAEVTGHRQVDYGTRYEVEPSALGALYTTTSWMDVSVEAPRKALQEVQRAMDKHAAKHVQRVKTLLESGLIPVLSSDSQ